MTHRWRSIVALLSLFVGAAGCTSAGSQQTASNSGQATDGASASTQPDAPKTATPPSSWVDERVRKARERLTASKAGEVVWEAIEAHGGLAQWYANGPLHFRYTYRPVDDGTERDTVQTIDTWRSLAHHRVADTPEHRYGWDGRRGWYHPSDWEPAYDVRFWALTPYYFVGMPFVLADPGVNLKLEAPDTVLGHECDVVRVTFGEDVGIAPDDFYVLYIDRQTRRLRALRYVVSYPKYFPKGGHSPEKLMTYEGKQTVGGIHFAKTYRFFMWDAEAKTEADVVTRAKLRDVEFRPETPLSLFEAPEGASIVDGDGD